MTDIPALLAKIPDELKPMAAIGIGAIMLVFIVLLHGAGLHFMLVRRQRWERRLRRERPYIFLVLLLFGWSVFLMLALHIAEFAIWAYALLYMGLIAHAYDALYFCANAYTTLGYGNVDLGVAWRNLSPIVGISGLFTMAWTTSALVGVVSSHRQLLEQIEDERESEIHMRLTLGKEEWDVLKKEREEERSEREKARTQASGASFVQQRAIWEDERKKDEELRKAMKTEIDELRRKERQGEEKLGSGTPPADSEHKEPQ
jgi:voltage-gated potassium channel